MSKPILIGKHIDIEFPCHTEQQEWTHEKLQGLLRITHEDTHVLDDAFEDTLDEINAALAAERQHIADLYQNLNDEKKSHRHTLEALAAECQLRDEAIAQREWLIKECGRIGVTVNVRIGAHITEAYQLVNTQLLSAQAAIEEVLKIAHTGINEGNMISAALIYRALESIN